MEESRMKEIRINSFTRLHNLIENHDAGTVIYRGVDRFSLFPGLDSLAAHIEWLQSKKH